MRLIKGHLWPPSKFFLPDKWPHCLRLKKSLVVTFLIFPEEGAMPEKDHVKAHKTIHEHWYVCLLLAEG